MATPEPIKRFTPQEIITKLDSQFEKARRSGDLLFFPSTVHKYTDAGIDVRFLLFSSSRNSKPQFPTCFGLPSAQRFLS